MTNIADLADAVLNKRSHAEVCSAVLDILTNDFIAQYTPNIHPLGFIHTKLGTTEDAEIRLHIWPEEQRPYQEPYLPIHNHIWRLDSHILTGQIMNRIYQLDNEPRADNRIFEVLYDGEKDRSIMHPTNRRVSKRVKEETRYSTGDHYNVPLDTYHESVVPDSTFTATLVATTNSEEERPKVVGPSNITGELTYDRLTCSTEDAQAYITRLRSTIS